MNIHIVYIYIYMYVCVYIYISNHNIYKCLHTHIHMYIHISMYGGCFRPKPDNLPICWWGKMLAKGICLFLDLNVAAILHLPGIAEGNNQVLNLSNLKTNVGVGFNVMRHVSWLLGLDNFQRS